MRRCVQRSIIHGMCVCVLYTDHLFDRKRRDELSHNTFLMLQECNKFREHQAREVLIELLEKQLVGRREALLVLKEQVQKANEALGVMET